MSVTNVKCPMVTFTEYSALAGFAKFAARVTKNVLAPPFYSGYYARTPKES